MNMGFRTNKTPIEIIREGAFGGIYFRYIYSGVNSKWYRDSWEQFHELKNTDQNYYRSNCYEVTVSKDKVKCGISLTF